MEDRKRASEDRTEGQVAAKAGLNFIEIPSTPQGVVPLAKYQELLNQAVDEQLSDLLICLGQEEQKVRILSDVVEAFGMDVQKLLKMHRLDDQALSLAEHHGNGGDAVSKHTSASRRLSQDSLRSPGGEKRKADKFNTAIPNSPTGKPATPEMVVKARTKLDVKITPRLLEALNQQDTQHLQQTPLTPPNSWPQDEAGVPKVVIAEPKWVPEHQRQPPPQQPAPDKPKPHTETHSSARVRATGSMTPRGEDQLEGLKSKCDQLLHQLERTVRRPDRPEVEWLSGSEIRRTPRRAAREAPLSASHPKAGGWMVGWDTKTTASGSSTVSLDPHSSKSRPNSNKQSEMFSPKTPSPSRHQERSHPGYYNSFFSMLLPNVDSDPRS